ncbi:NAD(P)/FAD-dependent oxidoreductase [Nocardiopsis sp. N85]|uniref:NAD(P)/FAD-dependent oxidoreductase n=1 Tax=Nocardiopsis sp. N85 TaxID=3029400 RepID=UPI00237F9A13|nr:NAD(P)/FAD-dependent oxidoreductase [Nocardiopsis sp. N85]MDE3720396.1 NAD(P)/FAD-dependent oxidoreductase [Nocardiopsis sp. N85]
MNRTCDVVIVGAGAAGLTAGIVLARAQSEVVVLDEGRPRNASAAHMHGFVSRDGVSPSEFLMIGRSELSHYGATLIETRVVAAERTDDHFVIHTGDGQEISSRAVLVASGLTDQVPHTPGVHELWGTAVHHCPHCHGWEVRGRELAVLGGGVPHMTVHQAALLRRYTDRVTLCPGEMELSSGDRSRLTAFGVRIIDGAIERLVTDDGRLTGVALADGSAVACEAVFIAPAPRANDDVLHALGCRFDPRTGWVHTEPGGATSVPGVWAAGNVSNPRAQVITAAGEASAAGIAISAWLLERDLAAAQAVASAEDGR